ncbi:MAG: hypothetical protein HYU97_08620 [Deltaproteobacteria bacterium]|nr:hypothetical protein [Deltaproteobacteria bacterium]
MAERPLKGPKPVVVAEQAPPKSPHDAQPTLKITDYAARSKPNPGLLPMSLQVSSGLFGRPFITFLDPIFAFNTNPTPSKEATAQTPDPKAPKKI